MKNERNLTSAVAIHANLIIHLYSGGAVVCEAEGHNAHARRFLAETTVNIARSVGMPPFRHFYVHFELFFHLAFLARKSFVFKIFSFCPSIVELCSCSLVRSHCTCGTKRRLLSVASADNEMRAVMLSNVCQFIHRFSKSTERFFVKSIIRPYPNAISVGSTKASPNAERLTDY